MEDSSNSGVESWLKQIKGFYGKDRSKQYVEEEPLLRAYLEKLTSETQPSRRLSSLKLQTPHDMGGTGIILRAIHRHTHQELALKFNRPRITEETRSILDNELRVLTEMNHSNIIRVMDMGDFDVEVDGRTHTFVWVVEPFIEGAMTLREYVKTLAHEDEVQIDDVSLDKSLKKMISVLHQWIGALAYLHRKGYVYLDVKPDNAIVAAADEHLLVIDFGSAQKTDPDDENSIMIYFSDPYADPRLMKKIERSATPERVKRAIKRKLIVPDFDYYALGKSILNLLELIQKHHPHDFPQRPLFESLHFLATRLLNGMNEERARPDELAETFGGLQRSDYETIQYKNLDDVLRDLEKELGSWDPRNVVPELETRPRSTLRVVPDINTVLTDRLKRLIAHPLLARLKMVSQLGLISLVYPTADHTRYDHVLGSYTYTACYIRSLFNDPQSCIFRNLIDENDIKAALLASIIHDLGQYPLAHDLQEVQPKIFDHSGISVELLSDLTRDKEGKTLLDVIQEGEEKGGWGLEVERLTRILRAHSGQLRLTQATVRDFKADMLSALIDGPIDADKADYIIRDSTNCRLPYGRQLDIERLLSVLTTVHIPPYFRAPHRVTIGIYEKGRASASAFSLARHLLYASVYWHHTSRIIKAMLQYAAAMILPEEVLSSTPDEGKVAEIREKLLQFIANLIPTTEQFREEIKSSSFQRAISEARPLSEEPTSDVLEGLKKFEEVIQPIEEYLTRKWYPGISVTDWKMLNWLKALAPRSENGLRGIALINLIQQRNLYKRIYTIPRDKANAKLTERLDSLSWPQKVKLCESMQNMIYDIMLRQRPTVETRSLIRRDEIDRTFTEELAILVDIPNYRRLTEPDRPLIYVPELQRKTYYRESMLPLKADNLVDALDSLVKSISPIRVLCHADVRQWIGAYIYPSEKMRAIVEGALDEVQL